MSEEVIGKASSRVEGTTATGIKGRLRAHLARFPFLWRCYQSGKRQILRLTSISFFASDISSTYRWMHWSSTPKDSRALSAELFFQFHKLEKGMVMPGERRMFGSEPAHETLRLLRRWQYCGFPVEDPVYLAATETLKSYLSRVWSLASTADQSLLVEIREFLSGVELSPNPLTPIPLVPGLVDSAEDLLATFSSVVESRKSVREFLAAPVELAQIRSAVALAMRAPSACNRQPCRVYVVERDEQRAELLSLQNGNRGFGHLAPLVLVITADQRCYFGASERHQPYIDGGLFSMNLLLGLTAQGLGSCCLNWCVSPSVDKHAHRVLGIPSSERIMMLVAVGHPVPTCQVPYSARRDIEEVFNRSLSAA